MNGVHDVSRGRWWSAGIVFLLACLPFAATPWFEFVEYDDPSHVYGHAVVTRGLTPRSIAWAFGMGTDGATADWFNWPLTWLSHMADVSLFGNWAGGHHLVSVLLHAFNAVLVLAVTRRLGLGRAAALVVAAVFAVHPVQVESVAWVSERKTVLCGFLMLVSMLVYLRWHEARGRAGGLWFLGWNILGGLAMLAKPLAVTLPCLFLVFDVAIPFRMQHAGLKAAVATAANRVAEKLPLLACAALDAAWTLSSQTAAGAVRSLPWADRLAHATTAYATYLRVCVWPVDLGCVHPHTGMPSVATLVAAATTLATATLVCMMAARRGRPLALAGWCWFLGTLVPMVGFVTVGANDWCDRYLYVPIIGLTVAALEVCAAGADALQSARGIPAGGGHTGAGSQRVGLGLAGAGIAVLAIAAWRQTSQWRDTPTLAARTLAGTNERHAHWLAWSWRGRHHARRREFAAAERCFAESLAAVTDPTRDAMHALSVHRTVGRMRLDDQRFAEAAEAFTAALTVDPSDLPSRLGLAVALSRAGDPNRAAEVFEQVLGNAPRSGLAWLGLGDVHLRAGRCADAVRCLDRAAELRPDDAAAVTLRAWARAACGDRAGARSDAARAAALGRPPDAALLKAIDAPTPPPRS